VKMSKKGDFEIPKVPNHNFSTKSVSNYCGFSNSKTILRIFIMV
jgi:hypothetical protein